MATSNPIEPEPVKNNLQRVRTGIDYTSKIQPLVSVCKKDNGNVEPIWLSCVALDDKTGDIYILDCLNNCVKVFDSTARYIFKFGDSNGEGKMSSPNCLVTCRFRILITHNHGILNYTLDGKYISRICKQGNGELEFNCPWGIAINESNDDIHICDYFNHQVQILSQDFQYKSQFGTFTFPLDVKLSKEYV
ncbi:hypothetical protein LOD99_79 [Oopsacas minuta]|uniref:Uncharacterized protein n=1 Tax=Oopsacas minuta TaxID=111878 RepID=A0AAV7K8I4_9METZ|nr:hypothetical protein LOD99_79 [Oopsacas minuta]